MQCTPETMQTNGPALVCKIPLLARTLGIKAELYSR